MAPLTSGLAILLLSATIVPSLLAAPETVVSERVLTAVLRWEVLWNEVPSWFQVPDAAPIEVVIRSRPGVLSYCGDKLGGCASYRIDAFRNPQRIREAAMPEGVSATAALGLFLDQGIAGQSNNGTVLGPGGLSGLHDGSFGVQWTAKIPIGPRSAILSTYRDNGQAGIDTLRRWLQSPSRRNVGYSFVEIPCFAQTDPLVYLYVDRTPDEPMIIAVFWDSEAEQWTEAAHLDGSKSRAKIESLRSVIADVLCATVKFR